MKCIRIWKINVPITSIIYAAVILFFGANAYAHVTGLFHKHDGDSEPLEVFIPPGPPVWETPATLSVERCINNLPPPDPPPDPLPDFCSPGAPCLPPIPPPAPLPDMCGDKPVSNEEGILFKRLDTIDQAIVSSSGTVRFGPFFLKRKGIGNAANTSDTYHITVLSRSLAIYGPGPNGKTQYLGANPAFKPIGFLETTLKGTEERVVFVTVKLRSVFNAIKIIAEIGDEMSHFPPGCTNLPALSDTPEKLDAECLQATVNPLAVLNIPYIPLGIIYEPPGNCSWSNLTNTHIAGTKLSMLREKSTSSQRMSDSGFFWNRESQDFTQGFYTGADSSVERTVTSSGSLGTEFGLPINSPGNISCNNSNEEVPARINAGPGYGEKFILLPSANFLYWDTEAFTATALSPIAFPGQEEGSQFTIRADALRTGGLLPGETFTEEGTGLTFTDEEVDAILSLSLFSIDSDGKPVVNLNSDRFLPIGKPRALPKGEQIEHMEKSGITVTGGQSLTRTTQSVEQSSESDFGVDLSMIILEHIATGAIKGVGLGFQKAAEGILEEAPTLFKDESTTTTTITFSNNERINTVSSDTVTQQFFVRDTTKGMNISIYYDRLFGTYAIVPHQEGTGMSTQPSIAKLPTVVWKITEQSIEDQELLLPRSIHDQLTSLGATTLQPSPGTDYRTVVGHSKAHMTAEVSLDTIGVQPTRLPAAVNPPVGKSQTLYVAKDKNGTAVAQFWISNN